MTVAADNWPGCPQSWGTEDTFRAFSEGRRNGVDHVRLLVVSDAIGETGESVARAAAAQFPDMKFDIRISGHIGSIEELRKIVVPTIGERNVILLYTFADGELHDEMLHMVDEGAAGIDVLGAAVGRIERITGQHPSGAVGALRRTDERYFDRIDAMEYAVNHDDGRNPDGWVDADILLLGASRTSKTPLSMYLAYRGLRTANIPLIPGVQPPHQLWEVDPRRIYGLISDVDTLLDIRRDRMRELGTYIPHYADREAVERELEDARRLMRQVGCIVINTANRAIEEVAQEILRYVEALESVVKRQRRTQGAGGPRGPRAGL